MVFCIVQKKKFRTTHVRIFIFFCRAKHNFFSPEFNIKLYDKNSESDYYFFPPPKSEYFFRKKNIPPPPPFQVKWSGQVYSFL